MPDCREAKHARQPDIHAKAYTGSLKVRMLNWARAQRIQSSRAALRQASSGSLAAREGSHRAQSAYRACNDLAGFAAAEEFSVALARLEAGKPFIAPAGSRSAAYSATKRLLDITGSIVAIVMFLPILIPVFLTLLVTTRGRPFFFQDRLGYCGRRFRMIKFRTMRLDADKVRHLVANEKDGPIFKAKRDPRITRIGRWLRRTSVDELPQLFNVLLGDMSLVGPRPPLAKEVAQYAPWQRRRLSVMPGLTCLWQVSGRSDIGFDQWVRMDLWYVRNQSLWTDIKLLLRTPWTVISMRGAY